MCAQSPTLEVPPSPTKVSNKAPFIFRSTSQALGVQARHVIREVHKGRIRLLSGGLADVTKSISQWICFAQTSNSHSSAWLISRCPILARLLSAQFVFLHRKSTFPQAEFTSIHDVLAPVSRAQHFAHQSRWLGTAHAAPGQGRLLERSGPRLAAFGSLLADC